MHAFVFIIQFLYLSSLPKFPKLLFSSSVKKGFKLQAMSYHAFPLCVDTYLPLYIDVVLSPFLVHPNLPGSRPKARQT